MRNLWQANLQTAPRAAIFAPFLLRGVHGRWAAKVFQRQVLPLRQDFRESTSGSCARREDILLACMYGRHLQRLWQPSMERRPVKSGLPSMRKQVQEIHAEEEAAGKCFLFEALCRSIPSGASASDVAGPASAGARSRLERESRASENARSAGMPGLRQARAEKIEIGRGSHRSLPAGKKERPSEPAECLQVSVSRSKDFDRRAAVSSRGPARFQTTA
jgi:cytochrome P450